MKQNVGGIDHILRNLIGIILIGWGMMALSWWGIVGLVMVFTGTSRWCPLYTMLGISTDHPENKVE